LQVWEHPEDIPARVGRNDENSDPFMQLGAQSELCVDFMHPDKIKSKRRPKKPTQSDIWKAELRERIEKEKARKIAHFKRV
jgi:hypothetical protein